MKNIANGIQIFTYVNRSHAKKYNQKTSVVQEKIVNTMKIRAFVKLVVNFTLINIIATIMIVIGMIMNLSALHAI